MIVIIIMLSIITIDSIISIYEFFKKIKIARYEYYKKQILANPDSNDIDGFWK